MAYNYNFNTQSPAMPQPTQQQIPNMQVLSQQNIQPLFPQPQGNVYNINSTVEVANVPVGAGMSVALCMPEGLMYIKTMQNGNPLFYPYKIIPFNANDSQPQEQKQVSQESISFEKVMEQLKSCNERIAALEEQINKNKKKGSDWDI